MKLALFTSRPELASSIIETRMNKKGVQLSERMHFGMDSDDRRALFADLKTQLAVKGGSKREAKRQLQKLMHETKDVAALQARVAFEVTIHSGARPVHMDVAKNGSITFKLETQAELPPAAQIPVSEQAKLLSRDEKIALYEALVADLAAE